ncbi:long-chain fatty acid--CoA ligase [Rhodococcus sp. 1163]|uniref:AMP-dependent synthetase/ligase n=1 Tax=Rhodococcus sp. 1163 TaxID=1905289 RepID=UPI00356B6EF7
MALRDLDGKTTVTWSQYAQRVRSIAAGLAELGVVRGDTIGLMMTNRPEFHLVDTAVLHVGATPFSVYNTNPAELLGYLFGNADNKVIICEQQFLPVVLAAREFGGAVDRVVCIDGDGDGVLTLAQVEAAPAADFDFEKSWHAVGAEDLVTIIYTSGTTGKPKGVEVSHHNILAESKVIDEIGGSDRSDSVISYLPDAHGANRFLAHYQNLITGASITTVDDPKRIAEALASVRPTIFLGVPRVWVKIKAGIEASVAEGSIVEQALANWAFGVGRARARANSERRSIGIADRVQHAVAERLVLSGVRAKLGLDNVRIAMTGAAPIPEEVHEYILGLGIPVAGGWGMTECTCAATIDHGDSIKIGTVGRVFGDNEVRLAEDGELLIRGPILSRGYRKEPEKNAEAIDSDGWLHSGDIGEIDDEGYVKIIDRKKELIISAGGKNMSPVNIESAILASSSLVAVAVTIGDARPYNTALIMLDPDVAAKFASDNGIVGSTAEFANDPKMRGAVQAGIDTANAKLSRVEQIKKFAIIPETWMPSGDYLTPKGSLKRKSIDEAYAELIDAIYEQNGLERAKDLPR